MPFGVFGGVFVCSSAEKIGVIRGKRVGMVVARDLREADLVSWVIGPEEGLLRDQMYVAVSIWWQHCLVFVVGDV